MTNTAEEKILNAVAGGDPLTVYRQLIAENDALIRGSDLDNGRQITAQRSAIHTALVRLWAEEQQQAFGYNKPFAVVALGGTGRAEMTPCSDCDFALLFDDVIEGNRFLLHLQAQLLHTTQFRDRFGFSFEALPFALNEVLENASDMEGKQLNSFLDMRPVHDPTGLAVAFREAIQSSFDPFDHFLHVHRFWKDYWEKAAAESERLDHFDIKNDGLRVFLAGVWAMAGKDFSHSHDVYRVLEDPRDLAAYHFLLRIRAFIHSRRPPSARSLGNGSHAEDILKFEDFTSFGEMLGAGADEGERFDFAVEVRSRILSARRRMAGFASGVIERELKNGRAVRTGSLVVCGLGGLALAPADSHGSPEEKSNAAFSLLLASQRYDTPIDPTELQTTYRNPGDWLIPTPGLAELFTEPRGSLADTFEFLTRIDGAEDRLFPGYARFEASLDDRVLTEKKLTRSALERNKLRFLEEQLEKGRARMPKANAAQDTAPPEVSSDIELETAQLDSNSLTAVKLALKTKRLPETPEDAIARADKSRPLHERFSSGFSRMPLTEYYRPYATEGGFLDEAVQLTEFLVTHRRLFKDWTVTPNEPDKAAALAKLCGNETRLRALYVFTCADRAEWDGEQMMPARWFNTRELYEQALTLFRPQIDPTQILQAAGFPQEYEDILQDFGADFFGGVYRRHAVDFGSALVKLSQKPKTARPKVTVLHDRASVILAVAAPDHPGLAASICGALFSQGIRLCQAHFFCAGAHRLALDFFHLRPGDDPVPEGLIPAVMDAIKGRLFIGEEDEANLPEIDGEISLNEWSSDLFHLQLESTTDRAGAVYAICCKIFHRLKGNIFGLSAETANGKATVSVYHSLPEDLTLDEARAIVEAEF
jgi:hypothetical protein